MPRNFQIIPEEAPKDLTADIVKSARAETIFRLTPTTPDALKKLGIQEGSGVVAKVMEDGMMIYFEGNLYNACNLQTLEEREQCAAGRLKHRYPTVACTFQKLEEVFANFKITIYAQE